MGKSLTDYEYHFTRRKKWHRPKNERLRPVRGMRKNSRLPFPMQSAWKW
jgi:hypothetical protein